MAKGPEKHYRLGPSFASRWLKCPYSINPDHPPLPDSSHPSAALGTSVHALAHGLIEGEPIPCEVADNVRRDANLYASHVLANEPDEILVEKQWVSEVIPDFGGTSDITMFKTVYDGQSMPVQQCAIYDYKNGKWEVVADKNPQIMCYAVLILEAYPALEEFYGVIVQPNSRDGQKIKPVAEYTLPQLDEHRDRIMWASDNPEHVQVGEHCRFCRVRQVKGLCPAGEKHAKKQPRWT